MKRHLPLIIFVTFSLHAFATEPTQMRPPKEAVDAMTASSLLEHIKVLASDEFEGRAPGSKGEELSVKYISKQFKALGLKPGNPNGSYTRDETLKKQNPKSQVNPNGENLKRR